MKILLVSEMYPPDSDGGQEVNAQKLANQLLARGHEVTVATAAFRDRYLGPKTIPNHVKRILRHGPTLEQTSAGKDLLKRTAAYLSEVLVHKQNARCVKRLVDKVGPDIAYVFGTSRIGLNFALECELKGVPVLWHQGGPNLERRLSQRLILGRLAKFFRSFESEELRISYDYVAYVSKFLSNAGSEYELPNGVTLGAKVRAILPRGIEFEFAEPKLERYSSGKIVMAGRIAHFKGFHVALKAARTLKESSPDLPWSIDIYGEADDDDVMGGISGSSYKQSLVEFIEEHGLGERVRFCGAVPRGELLERFEEAAVFVSASDCGEAFANTIIEAGGKGAVLIVSDDGSAREVVQDQVTGLVFQPADDIALSKLLFDVLADPSLAFSYASASTQRLKQLFGIESIVDQTEAVMQQVLELHSAPSTK